MSKSVKVTSLSEHIDQFGLYNTAKKFDYHHNNIRNMADRGAMIVDGEILAPVKKRPRKVEVKK